MGVDDDIQPLRYRLIWFSFIGELQVKGEEASSMEVYPPRGGLVKPFYLEQIIFRRAYDFLH